MDWAVDAKIPEGRSVGFRNQLGSLFSVDDTIVNRMGNKRAPSNSVVDAISTPPRYLLRDLWHGEDLQEVKVGER